VREPVTTAAELLTLDPDEVQEGYRDGFAGEPEPGDNRSKAYWHGWRNAWIDRNNITDPSGPLLIKDMRKHGIWPFGDIRRPIPSQAARRNE